MSGTLRAGSYRAVLSLPRAAPTFAAALLGRLSYGLLPLSLLFTVRDATGSFATAGAALGLVGITSLTLPAKARLIDRYGTRRTLPSMALLAAAALGTTASLQLDDVLCLVLSGVAGLAAPPLGPTMRGTWSQLTEGTELRPTAYSLDAVGEETLYVLGPVLVGASLVIVPARAALGLAACVMAVGTLAMVALAPRPAPSSSRRSSARWSPWRTPAFLGLVGAVGVVALALSLTVTAIAATAQAVGEPAAAGWVEAGLAIGSVVGGLLWGRRAHTRPWPTHLAGLALLQAAGPAVAVAGGGLLLIGSGMTLTGLAVAPLFVVAYLASDALAPADRRIEASTWVNTGNNVGSAVGSALGGLAVQHLGTRPAYGMALALLLVLALGSAATTPARGTPVRRPEPVAGPERPGGRRRRRAGRRCR